MAGIIESSPAHQNFSRYDIRVIIKFSVMLGKDVQYYKKVLQDKLRPAIRKKRPGLLESGILFHQNNAPVHTARAVTNVLAGYKWELLEHPRYSSIHLILPPVIFTYSLK
ncbi:histone-lysine N-methyltransferase SETMAR [Elysia marginata]|uniref:Histone-lysine N-methyltransferase SETMAR n=1 Tax=Elysia marginata TaxID=1093978 RepID=A0AAV4JXT7_9GAST|nr:histone-lysine N-methyltransferase SETMAR [Elysia marginata]